MSPQHFNPDNLHGSDGHESRLRSQGLFRSRGKALSVRLGIAGLTLMMIAPPVWAIPGNQPERSQRSADRQRQPQVRGHSSKPGREARSERRENRRNDRSERRGSASQRNRQEPRREGRVSQRQERRSNQDRHQERRRNHDRRQEQRHEIRRERRQDHRQEHRAERRQDRRQERRAERNRERRHEGRVERRHERRADRRHERRADRRHERRHDRRQERRDHRYNHRDYNHGRRGYDYRSDHYYNKKKRYHRKGYHHYNRDHYRVKRGYESKYHRRARHREWIRRQNRAWYDCYDYGGFFVRLGRYLDYRFDVPRFIHYDHVDRYDDYYYGQVYHGPHDEIYDVYLFPVYLHDRVEYRPYVYCEGKFFGRARFDSYGGLKFEVGFRF